MLEQRQKDYIDQELMERQTGPVKALCDEKERALRVLEEPQRFKDDAAEMERRIVDQCKKCPRTWRLSISRERGQCWLPSG